MISFQIFKCIYKRLNSSWPCIVELHNRTIKKNISICDYVLYKVVYSFSYWARVLYKLYRICWLADTSKLFTKKKTVSLNGLMHVYNRTQRYGVALWKTRDRRMEKNPLPFSARIHYNQYSLWQISGPASTAASLSVCVHFISSYTSFFCCCCCSGDGVCYHTIFSIQTAEHSLYIVRRARKLNVNAVLLLRLLLLV